MSPTGWIVSRRGQAIVEYLVIATVIIGALIALRPSLRSAVSGIYNSGAAQATAAAGNLGGLNLTGGLGGTPGGGGSSGGGSGGTGGGSGGGTPVGGGNPGSGNACDPTNPTYPFCYPGSGYYNY